MLMRADSIFEDVCNFLNEEFFIHFFILTGERISKWFPSLLLSGSLTAIPATDCFI